MILSNKCSFSYSSKLIIKRKTCDRFDRVVIQNNESLRTIMTWALLLSAAINRIFMNRITRHSQYNTVLTIAAYCIQYVWFHAYPLLNCWIESFCMTHAHLWLHFGSSDIKWWSRNQKSSSNFLTYFLMCICFCHHLLTHSQATYKTLPFFLWNTICYLQNLVMVCVVITNWPFQLQFCIKQNK